MIKIGITGSIASGKTTASKFISRGKGPLFSADKIVKKLYSKTFFKKLLAKKLKIEFNSEFKKIIKNKILREKEELQRQEEERREEEKRKKIEEENQIALREEMENKKRMEEENKQVQSDDIQIDLSEDVANGVYSNFVVTNMNSEEFVFDFTYLQPYANKGSVRSRVIMSPRNAKKLHQIFT